MTDLKANGAAAKALIAAKVPNPAIRERAERFLQEIEQGARDFRF